MSADSNEATPIKHPSFGKRVCEVVVLTAIVTAASVTVALLLDYPDHTEANRAVMVLLLLVLILGLPLSLFGGVATAIFSPLEQGLPWIRHVVMVLLGYGSTIVMFSAVYFGLAALGDYNQAVSNNLTFQYQTQYNSDRWKEMTKDELLKWLVDTRSFKGINGFLYLDINQDGPLELRRRYFSGAEIIALAQDSKERKPRKNMAAAFPIWLDCLHLSIVTAATVGYGDIVPTSPWAKLATDFQILASTAILVFGFGFIVSGRDKEQKGV